MIGICVKVAVGPKRVRGKAIITVRKIACCKIIYAYNKCVGMG